MSSEMWIALGVILLGIAVMVYDEFVGIQIKKK